MDDTFQLSGFMGSPKLQKWNPVNAVLAFSAEILRFLLSPQYHNDKWKFMLATLKS